MIKLEKTQVVGWEPAIRGMRNPKNSWEKSDSFYTCSHSGRPCEECIDLNGCKREAEYRIGPNDHDLMMRLAKGGPVHAKYRRMINVYVDITAPLYWIAELDTYKIGTVRNSCSFMHKGVSKPFEIDDFSVKNELVYKVLRPLERKTYELDYPYQTDDYRPYVDANGRSYKVYRNGFVIREGFDYTDNYGSGRTRHFDDSEATVYQNREGYFIIKMSGRNGGQMLLHRLVASVWCEKPEGATQVNHKDGNKGNNSAENLEWVTASENMEHGVEYGLYNELGGIHQRYKLWKHNVTVIPTSKRMEFKTDCDLELTHKELAKKWNITPEQANNVRYVMRNNEHEDLFQECYIWDSIIDQLNYMRSLYIETRDEKIFQAIRCVLPQGYMQKSTYMFNYETLCNIYHSRHSHRLDEWRDFCSWIEELPYSEIILAKPEKEVEEHNPLAHPETYVDDCIAMFHDMTYAQRHAFLETLMGEYEDA